MDHEILATLLRIAEAIEARGAERMIDGECTTVYLDALVDASARVREAHRYCAALGACHSELIVVSPVPPSVRS